MTPVIRPATRAWPAYRTVWRWHFYAGLFCIPFVIWLAVTGSVYLFKPQIEAWLDRPYDELTWTGAPVAPSAIVVAALAAVPGSVLNAYQLPPTPGAAVRILVGDAGHLTRVYVHPQTLAILHVIDEDARLMNWIQHLHGELMLGDRGSLLVELAASWAIVMLLTGLFLWWPRHASGLAGVVYPRLCGEGRRFWRDLHGVTGFWVSFFALFLLLSGLPWARSWGGLLKEARRAGSELVVQDWTTGRASELALRSAQNAATGADEHAAHHGHAGPDGAPATQDLAALDRLVPAAQALRLAPPVLVAPPSAASPTWSARSDAQNRPARSSVSLDAQTGAVLARADFADKALLDRVIGVGIAAHEGQLFGAINQALGLFTAIGLILVSCSAVLLWWRRRPAGTLGAPAPQAASRMALTLVAVVAAIGIVLPMFGMSLVVVLLADKLLLRHLPRVRRVLGMQARAS